MSIDDYIQQRNEIMLAAENENQAVADRKWIALGVANRHIQRVLDGELSLTPAVEQEIQRCLESNR
jgi:hypothetical protein